MNPQRKNMPTHNVPLLTVMRKACASPAADSSTAPICSIARFNIRSPALAQTTIAHTMTSVFTRSLPSVAILSNGSVVPGSRRRLRHGNHGLGYVAAASYPLPAFRTELKEARCFVIEPLAFVRIPQRFAHDPPHNTRPEVVLIIETVHAAHHLGLREMRIFDVRQLVPARIRKRFHLQEAFPGHRIMQLSPRHGMRQCNLNRL